MSKKYVVVIEPSDDEYYAYVPEIPGCVSGGSTLEETLENVKEAISLALEFLDQPLSSAQQPIVLPMHNTKIIPVGTLSHILKTARIEIENIEN